MATQLDTAQNDKQAEDFSDIIKNAQKSFQQVKFFIAKSSAQHENGLAEANFAVAKKLLYSLTGHLQKSNLLFESCFQLSGTFVKIAGQLNTRPIFYDQEKHLRSMFHLAISKDLDVWRQEVSSNLSQMTFVL